MKEALIGLIILSFVVPFSYFFIVDIIDLISRFIEVYQRRLKPAVVVTINSFLK